ncbi:MAG: phosphoenolpyruvate carboxylase [Alphaproteobacteria bacterium]|nr:phosphoenolpyruvate carboxylase [Alphaproteobacteria bacterium]
MLDHIEAEKVTPEYLRSFYQQRVARASFAPVLDHVIPDEDKHLIPDIKAISEVLLEPVLDASTLPDGALQDAERLKKLFDLDQRGRLAEHEVFQALIKDSTHDDETLNKILDHVIRIGQLVKAAAAQAHDNVVDEARMQRTQLFELFKEYGGPAPDVSAIIPDSVEGNILELIKVAGITSFAELKVALAKPRVISVSTSHPTRYLIPEFTEDRLIWALAHREMTRRVAAGDDQAFYDYANGSDASAAFKALKEWWQRPITFTDKNGRVANMTPHTEMRAAMMDASDDFTRNIFQVYRTFDDGLQRLSDAGLLPFKYGDEERLDLSLSFDFSTWVMGDKDGNNNIRSEHLLMATVVFRERAAKNYAEQLKRSGLELRRADGVLWSDYFEAKQANMNRILMRFEERIEAAGGGIDLPLTRKEFIEAREAVEAIYGDINAVNAELAVDLTRAYRVTEDTEPKAHALSLLRKTRIMGLGLLKLQLRETAEMYTPVLDTLFKGDKTLFNGNIQNYGSKDTKDDAKLAWINIALQEGAANPEKLTQLKDNFFARLKEQRKNNAKMRNYMLPKKKPTDKDEVDPDVITLHTLQRYEVGTIQKGLITDHVLAECESALQVMETLLLAKVCGISFTIVPLLEERKTLKLAAPIFLELFEQPAWRDHIWQETNGDLTRMINILKVQFAHSDNMRRMGFAPARGNIYKEANQLPLTFEEACAQMLDHYMKDGRINADEKRAILIAMDANPTAFEPQQFHGGSRCDTARGGVGSTIAFSKHANLRMHYEGTDQGGDNPEIRFMDRFKRTMTTLISKNALELARKEKGLATQWDADRAAAHIEAIDEMIGDYEKNHYGPHNQLGRVMAEVGFYRENQAYNMPGCRGERSSSGGITPIKPDISPILPEKIRTIGFTSTGMDMSVGFAVLPMRSSFNYFNKLYDTREDLREKLQRDAGGQEIYDHHKKQLTAIGLETLYRVDPIFRAAVSDFPAFGVAISNLPLTVKMLNEREANGAPKVSQETMDYFEKSLPRDVVGVAIPYLMAKAYTIPEEFISKDELANPNPVTAAKLGFLIREVTMPHISEQLGLTARFQDLSRIAREDLFTTAMQTPNVPYTPAAEYRWRQAGVLRGMYGHQIFDGAADFTMGMRRIATRPIHEAPLQPKAYYQVAAA